MAVFKTIQPPLTNKAVKEIAKPIFRFHFYTSPNRKREAYRAVRTWVEQNLVTDEKLAAVERQRAISLATTQVLKESGTAVEYKFFDMIVKVLIFEMVVLPPIAKYLRAPKSDDSSIIAWVGGIAALVIGAGYRLARGKLLKNHLEADLGRVKLGDNEVKTLAKLAAGYNGVFGSVTKIFERAKELVVKKIGAKMDANEVDTVTNQILIGNSHNTWRAEKVVGNLTLAAGAIGLFTSEPGVGVFFLGLGTMLHVFRQLSFDRLKASFERALN